MSLSLIILKQCDGQHALHLLGSMVGAIVLPTRTEVKHWRSLRSGGFWANLPDKLLFQEATLREPYCALFASRCNGVGPKPCSFDTTCYLTLGPSGINRLRGAFRKPFWHPLREGSFSLVVFHSSQQISV